MKQSAELLIIIILLCNGCKSFNTSNTLPTNQIDSNDYPIIKKTTHIQNINKAPENCGGLIPNYPLATGHVLFNSHSKYECEDWIDGGLLTQCKKVIVKKGDNYIVINNEEELRKIYAPITSKNEALSFAILSTRWFAIFDNAFFKNSYKYFGYYKPRTSYVEQDGNEYTVHLFAYQTFGCSHPYFTVTATITRDGTIYNIIEKEAFFDPQDGNICVD